MVISLVLFLIFFNLIRIDLSDYFTSTVSYLNGVCLNLVPESEYREVYEAIGCGKRISSIGLREILATTGLVHIFVVSGTHLSFFGKLLSKLKIPSFLEIIILGVYSMATSFNPPVVRAFLSFLFKKLNKRYCLAWPKDTLVWHVSFFCLIIFNKWFESFSFMLSWAAALGISYSAKTNNLLAKNACIYLVMFPVLMNISTPHPIVILINTLVLPIFGLIFFPLTLLTLAINFISPISDFIWKYFLWLLSFLSNEIPLFKADTNLSYMTMFLYLITLHIVLLIYRFWKRYRRIT